MGEQGTERDGGSQQDGGAVVVEHGDGSVAGGCWSSDDCQRDETCYFYEGGCAAGRCERYPSCVPDASASDAWTSNGLVYCGCDGLTFQPSGCVDTPWMNAGECSGADGGTVAEREDGSIAEGCWSSDDCQRDETCYFYEGGCAAGRCERYPSCVPDASVSDAWTSNGLVYCGCDGLTFQPSGCVDTPWLSAGECSAVDGGVDPGFEPDGGTHNSGSDAG